MRYSDIKNRRKPTAAPPPGENGGKTRFVPKKFEVGGKYTSGEGNDPIVCMERVEGESGTKCKFLEYREIHEQIKDGMLDRESPYSMEVSVVDGVEYCNNCELCASRRCGTVDVRAAYLKSEINAEKIAEREWREIERANGEEGCKRTKNAKGHPILAFLFLIFAAAVLRACVSGS